MRDVLRGGGGAVVKPIAIEIAPGVEVVADLDRANRGQVIGVVFQALKALDFDEKKISAFFGSGSDVQLRRVLHAAHDACYSEQNLEFVDGGVIVSAMYDVVLRIEAEGIVTKALGPADENIATEPTDVSLDASLDASPKYRGDGHLFESMINMLECAIVRIEGTREPLLEPHVDNVADGAEMALLAVAEYLAEKNGGTFRGETSRYDIVISYRSRGSEPDPRVAFVEASIERVLGAKHHDPDFFANVIEHVCEAIQCTDRPWGNGAIRELMRAAVANTPTSRLDELVAKIADEMVVHERTEIALDAPGAPTDADRAGLVQAALEYVLADRAPDADEDRRRGAFDALREASSPFLVERGK